jgi:hypothetical protein
MSDILRLKEDYLDSLWAKNNELMESFKKNREEFSKYLDSIGLLRQESGQDELYCKSSSDHSMYMSAANGLDLVKLYRLNSFGFRSNEFVSKHSGLHVLFSGCSVTYGDSLPLNYIWPQIVHSLMPTTSGFFNLASPGNTIAKVIQDIFRYIDSYGVPDVAFILFPDFKRGIVDGKIRMTLENDYQEYLKLEILFSEHNKTLISSSWAIRNKVYPLNSFKTFMKFKPKDLNRFVYDNTKTLVPEEDRVLLLRAADLAHPGILEHRFYADLMYNGWYEKNN